MYTCRFAAGEEVGNVDPSDRDQNDPGNSAPAGDEPTHTIGMPGDSDDWLRFVIQNSSEIVKVVDPDGTLRYANPAFGRILGYDPWEASGKNVFDFIHPDDLSRVLEETERVISGGVPGGTNVVEYRFRHKDGSWRWMEGVETSYQPNDLAVRGIVLSARDITKRKGSEERLRKAEERYRTLVERAPAITYIHLQEPGSFSGTAYVSPQIEAVLGYTQEEYASDPEFWKTILHPDDCERVLADDERTGDTGEPFTLEFRMIAKDGRIVWLRESGTLGQDEDGRGQVLHGVMVDITELKHIEGELREAERRYRTLVEQIPAATYIDRATNGPDAPLYTSPQIEGLLGYTPEEWLEGRLWREHLHPEDRERVLATDERFEREGEELFGEEYRLIAKDGSVVWVQEEAVLVKDEVGSPLYWQGILYNITERKRAEEQMEHRAFHDALTELPNRRLLLDRLGHALARTERREGTGIAVLFLDLDRFKVINDSLGHEAGDRLLVAVAERLKGCLRPEDTLARFGGDEFVILVEDVEGPAQAIRVAERLIDDCLKDPFVLEGRELYVRTSMGIAFGTARTKSAQDLLRDADTAMYRAKYESLGYAVFDSDLYERAVRRLQLENDLRRAVEGGEFVLHYQPIFDLSSQGVWGIEALVRWQHPERGLLGPSEFVALAEETGVIAPMGRWVLEEACRQTKEWQQSYPRSAPLRVIVNLSPTQLHHPGCEEIIREALSNSGLGAESLSLDVTESACIDAFKGNALILQRIEHLGVGISIDDFGTGFSSLSYLKRLPANALKIDKSFIKSLGEDVEDTAIVQMVVELAHTLVMKAIAEGVETKGQVALLKEMGCDMVQGFHFARPLPPEAVSEFLLAR